MTGLIFQHVNAKKVYLTMAKAINVECAISTVNNAKVNICALNVLAIESAQIMEIVFALKTLQICHI